MFSVYLKPEYFRMEEEPLQTADADPPLGTSAGESLSWLPSVLLSVMLTEIELGVRCRGVPV